MTDLINRSLAVPSPCVRICRLDAQEICTGCGRSLDEIARWSRLSDDERRVVVARSADRLHPGAASA